MICRPIRCRTTRPASRRSARSSAIQAPTRSSATSTPVCRRRGQAALCRAVRGTAVARLRRAIWCSPAASTTPKRSRPCASSATRTPRKYSSVVRAWHHGRYRATRSQRARELLTELMPALLEALAKTTNPDAAFVRFDEFLAGLPAGVQLFSLLYQNPGLLDLLAEIMGSASALAQHLSRRPFAVRRCAHGGLLRADAGQGPGWRRNLGARARPGARLPGYSRRRAALDQRPANSRSVSACSAASQTSS